MIIQNKKYERFSYAFKMGYRKIKFYTEKYFLLTSTQTQRY